MLKNHKRRWLGAGIVLLFAAAVSSGCSLLASSGESQENKAITIGFSQDVYKRQRLRQKQSIQEYHLSQASLARAMTRLKTSKEKHWNI